MFPDRVELLRNGTVEVLHFPQVRSPSYIPDEPADVSYQDEVPMPNRRTRRHSRCSNRWTPCASIWKKP